MKWGKSVRNVKKLMKKHMAWPNASPHACGACTSTSCCSNASPDACRSEILRSADQTRAQTRPRPPHACPHASKKPELQKKCLPLPGHVPGRVSQHQTRVHTRVHVIFGPVMLKSLN